MRKRIAIIPARDGSKRLKNKNELTFGTKPLYEYSVLAALDSVLIDSYYVSTDSITIQNDCKKKGYNFLIRPKNLSMDESSTSDVMQHIVQELNLSPEDEILILQPSNPLRKKGFIDNVIFASENIDEWTSFFSITKFDNKIVSIESEILRPINYQLGQRSQDMINELYYENGKIYISKVDTILRFGNIFGSNPKGYICEEGFLESDIDTMEDFEIAHLKYILFHEKFNLI